MAKNTQKQEIEVEEIKEEKKKWEPKEGELVVDVYETEKELVVESAIAGMDGEKLDVSLEGDVLIIKGKRENPSKDKDKAYFIKDCYWGSFSKEIILPRSIDTSKIDAKIKDGILTIRMAKIEKAKSKKISVEE